MAARLQKAVVTCTAVYVLDFIRDRRSTARISVMASSLCVIMPDVCGTRVTLCCCCCNSSAGTFQAAGMALSISLCLRSRACCHGGSSPVAYIKMTCHLLDGGLDQLEARSSRKIGSVVSECLQRLAGCSVAQMLFALSNTEVISAMRHSMLHDKLSRVRTCSN